MYEINDFLPSTIHSPSALFASCPAASGLTLTLTMTFPFPSVDLDARLSRIPDESRPEDDSFLLLGTGVESAGSSYVVAEDGYESCALDERLCGGLEMEMSPSEPLAPGPELTIDFPSPLPLSSEGEPVEKW